MYLDKEKPFSLLGVSIWGIAVLFFLYEFFLRVFIGTLADQIIPDLRLSVAAFTLIGTSYHVAYGIMQVPVGLLVDRFGVKYILAFATLVCSFSVFLFAYSTGVKLAFFSRLLMGFGSSFAFVCLLVIVSTWFSRKYFGFLAGLSQFIGTMGPLLAGRPLVDLLTKSNGDWRLILNAIGLVGLILFVSVLLVVKNNMKRDLHKLVVLKPKTPIMTILRQLSSNPQAWLIAFYSATVYVPLSIMGTIWGTTYLETNALSQIDSASVISVTWLGYALSCVAIGLYSDKKRRRKSALILCSCIGIISTIGILYTGSHTMWLYSLLFFGLGLAASGQNIGFAIMAEHVAQSTHASALGLNNAFIAALNAIIQLSIGLVINQSVGHSNHLGIHDFMVGFAIIPILYLFALITSTFFIAETYCRPKKEMIILKRRLESA